VILLSLYVICQVLCHGRNTDGESHRFTGDSNPEEMFSKVSELCGHVSSVHTVCSVCC